MKKLYSGARQPLAAALSAAFMVATVSHTGSAQASATIKIDDTKWVSVGAGMRTSYNSQEDGAPNGDDWSKDFLLDSVRLYINGQIHNNIYFTYNTEREEDQTGDSDIRTLDAIARFEFDPMFNVWAGRHLPPTDRSNLSGPYYLNAWNFPIAQQYPAIFAGRDDGATVWGETMFGGTQFKYAAGAYEGTDGGPNQDDNLEFSGRVVLNFWDAEPGYYNSSTYYGDKDILAIGLVYMTQEDGVGTAANSGDFRGASIDALMEKKLGGGGVVSLEGAYYDYDRDNVATNPDSDGYFALASFLFPQTVGWGQFQPMVRFQNLDVDDTAETEVIEVGLNYIIDGHNARISAVYSDTDIDNDNGPDNDYQAFQIGVQLQI